jgi:hypothetical protein
MQPLDPSDPRAASGYRLIGRLGVGGMGQVFLAQSPTGALVALKTILPGLAHQEEFRARFRREVTAAKAVRGPYVAEVVDADLDGDPPWLATQYVGGPSLSEAVSRHGPLPSPAVAALGAAVATALLAVERAGLVHRDLKPANVLLGVDGPRVIDFGIAKAAEATTLTQAGMLVGTPGYMAPEQIDGVELSTAVDVFSLGAVLTYALTGTRPFGEGTLRALIGRILFSRPDLSGVPVEWRDLLAQCLAKNPADRPALPALIDRLVPDGRPVADLFGPGWLPEAVGAYVRERASEAATQAAALLPPAEPPAAETMPAARVRATTPRQHLARLRRRRRVWPVVAVLAVAAAIAIPATVWQVVTSPEETNPGSGPLPSGSGQPAPVAAEPPAGEVLPAEYAGSWSGEVDQSDTDDPYPVHATLDGGEVGAVVGTIRYWTLQCSGELQLDAVATDHIRVTERITEDENNCAERVPLRFELLSDGGLRYVRNPDGDGPPTAEGSLLEAPDRLPDRFAGTWEGDIDLGNAGPTERLTMEIEGGRVGSSVGTIEYRACASLGTLRLEQVDGDTAWFRWVPDPYGWAPRCSFPTVVALTLTGDRDAWYAEFDDPRSLGDPRADDPLGRS